MINRFEKFTFFIEEVAKLLHKISSDEMEFFGLKGPYAIYLLMIADHPEGITSAQISDRCGRNKADVSRAVTALIGKGLITRTSSGSRNYRALIKLTADGEKAVSSLRETAKRAVEYASHDIPAEDISKFYDTLETIYNNLTVMGKIGVPEDN